MTIVNLTPHALNFVGGLNVAPSGQIARVATRATPLPDVGGLKAVRTEWGEVTGLPVPAPDTVYIVSSLVLARCGGRPDVYAPGAPVRDADGKIVGADGLQQ